jgi:hypothetical protein
MKSIVFLLAAGSLFGGQSIVLNGAQASNGSFPNRSKGLPWRAEFYLHDWAPTAQIIHLVNAGGVGLQIDLYNLPGNLFLQSFSWWDTGGSVCQIGLGSLSPQGLYVRVQRDPATKTSYCEAWDTTGARIHSSTHPYTSDNDTFNATGATIGDINSTGSASLGFLRIESTLLPINSRMPVTADNTDTLLHWKFDGSLSDSSGQGYSATVSSGQIAFAATPNQNVISVLKTLGSPTWANWTSLRAGAPGQLDGTASFSQADASPNVSYFWQCLSGPSVPLWDNRGSGMPTLTGLVFGTYNFALSVTDTAGKGSTSTVQVGAVATDAKGVVVNADPNVDRLFGPMIAFGKNPWGYADERALTATTLRTAAYKTQQLDPPSWETPSAGKVTYTFNGAGPAGAASTTLCAAIPNATATTVTVCDATKLDLTSLPTRILVGGSAREEIRICSASGNVLTACYDGRGWNQGGSYLIAGAQAWSNGTPVGQMKVGGNGTAFLSTICLSGTGPSGTVAYHSGTVAVTHGSASIIGVGTSWSTGNNVIAGYAVRILATHGGTPFVFSAYITNVSDATHITMNRIYPSDADDGSFSYSVIAADIRQMVLHYNRATDGSDSKLYFYTSGCESDTNAYLFSGHDIAGLNGTVQSQKAYSYMDGFGYASAFGVNFYGEDLAHRVLYYRSGWQPALDAANVMGDNFVKSPVVAGGDAGGIPLLLGGGVIGGFVSAILTGRTSWSDLRGLARMGSIGGSGCNDFDTRDSSYLGTWLTLAALYDPDPAQRSSWKASLGTLNGRDNSCKGSDNSWANGFLFNSGNYPALTMTTGSAIATGANLPSSMCLGKATGTLNATNGSATVSGTGFIAGNKIVIIGVRNSAAYVGVFRYQLNSPTSITLAALWPGDTAAGLSYMIEGPSSLGYDGDFLATIGQSANDPQLRKIWSCVWNNAGQITLNRAWDGPAGTEYLFKYVLAGFGQQPYMLGIKTLQMEYGSQIDDPALASGYAALDSAAAAWIHDVGYDPVTQGMHYGRIYGGCEPSTTPPASPLFDSRTPNCNNGLDPASVRTSRVLTAEASHGLRVYYESAPSQARKDWGDQAYGSIWGYAPYTTGGVYADSNYVRDENSNGSLGGYKWTGFFFGMGMSHQWPAVRLGGVAPAANRTIPVAFNLASVPNAAKITVILTAPSGAVQRVTCSSSPCVVSGDARQGNHLIQVQYLSAGNIVLASGEQQIAAVP